MVYCLLNVTNFHLALLQAAVQPGSLDTEAGIFQMKFDQSGSRLITCEADKTIKVIFKCPRTVIILNYFSLLDLQRG